MPHKFYPAGRRLSSQLATMLDKTAKPLRVLRRQLLTHWHP